MRKIWALLLTSLLSSWHTFEIHAHEPAADLILTNAKVWAGIKEPTTNTAIAVRDGRILAVGDDKTMLGHRGPATKVIDIQGQRLVPGFHDSHVHFLGAGIFLGQIDLKLCANEAEFGKMLREYDQKLPPGRWLLGGNWDHDRTFNGVLPTAAMIDKYVSPDRPVYIRRYDGHMALANTVAMKKAGINAATQEIKGGEIVRQPGTQEPTGILRDNAMSLMGSVIPGTDEEDIVRGIRRALDEARSVGVTAVDDIDGSGHAVRTKLWKHYKNLEAKGELSVRVRLFWPISEARGLADLIANEGRGTGLAQLGGVKGFMDGSLGSSTAKMFDPYRHDTTTTGVWVTPPSAMLQYAMEADKLGLQVVVHAIGDEANAKLLDIYTQVNEKNGPRDRRFRIEHAQHLRQEDYPRFAAASVIASMQPYHVVDDAKWAEGRIGTERCSSSYAYRSLLDNGAMLSFGSDWAVAPLNPLVGIDAAVNRRSLDDKYPGGWFPAQKIKVEEALHAYTAGAAYAMFAEKQQGVLKPGMNADLVVLDRDILDKNEQDNIGKTMVVMTIVNGKIVYQR
jgi:predicted amidohydrolase YtcJ